MPPNEETQWKQRKKRRGARTEPWGTPQVKGPRRRKRYTHMTEKFLYSRGTYTLRSVMFIPTQGLHLIIDRIKRYYAC